MKVTVACRSSPLSKAQIKEVEEELSLFFPSLQFVPTFLLSRGDLDLTSSLRNLEKTDFFTKEIDALQLAGGCRISIHSAKDLPEPLTRGLAIAALTKGVDPTDVIVLREGDTIESLPQNAKIGTSSVRREENVLNLRSDLQCTDVRGNILARLKLLDQGFVDGLVMAEAALIRLNLTQRNRIQLPGISAPLQGKLAVVVLENDAEMLQLFTCIDGRKS